MKIPSMILAGTLSVILASQGIQAAEGNNLPDDIKVAIYALLERMRDVPATQIQDVSFAGRSAEFSDSLDFHYNGFRLLHFTVLDYAPDKTQKNGARLTADLIFGDRMGRRAMAMVAARYHMDPRTKHLVIDEAAVTPRDARTPNVQLFVIPEESLSADEFKSSKLNHAQLYERCVKAAIRIDGTSGLAGKRRPYMLFFFILGRLPDDPTLEIKIANIPTRGIGVRKPNLYTREFKGWAVLALHCSATISADPPATVRLLMTPRPTPMDRQEQKTVEIGRFTLAPHVERGNTRPVAKAPQPDGFIRASGEIASPTGSFAQGVAAQPRPQLSAPSAEETAPPPLPDPAQWYTGTGGKRNGPFATALIEKQIQDGVLTRKTMVWKKGMEDWAKAGTVEDLKDAFASQPPPLPQQ